MNPLNGPDKYASSVTATLHGIFGLLAGSAIFTFQLFFSLVILNWTGHAVLASLVGISALFPVAIIVGWFTGLF